MNLELNDMRSFAVLSQTLHFGKAAERLHISQPALTKQVQKMEARLGATLLERGSRKVRLTRVGEVLRDEASRLLERAQQAQRMVELAVQGHSGFLRVGFGIATLGAGLGPLLREYRKRYPEVRVSLKDMPTPAQLEALENDRISVGFVRLPVASPAISTIGLLEERLIIAYPTGSRPRGEKGLASLADTPFIGMHPGVSRSFHDHLYRTCRVAGFVPNVVQEASELLTMLHLVGAGLGVALVPRSARQMRVPHVSFRETEVEEAVWSIGLAWHERSQEDPLVRAFLALATQGPRAI